MTSSFGANKRKLAPYSKIIHDPTLPRPRARARTTRRNAHHRARESARTENSPRLIPFILARRAMSHPRVVDDVARKHVAPRPSSLQLPSASARGRELAFASAEQRADRIEMRSFSRTTVLSAPTSQATGTLTGLRAETGARSGASFVRERAPPPIDDVRLAD